MDNWHRLFDRFSLGLVVIVGVLNTGCYSQVSKSLPVKDSNIAQTSGQLDACALIAPAEIADVQGARVRSTQPSNQKLGTLVVSRCYFAIASAENSDLSVHLEVIQPEATNTNSDSLRTYWEKSVLRSKSKGEGQEDEKGATESRPLSGVADEAFWIGNEKAGVLFALYRNRVVRVGIGGPSSAEIKIEKSKTLAATVLKRLPQNVLSQTPNLTGE